MTDEKKQSPTLSPSDGGGAQADLRAKVRDRVHDACSLAFAGARLTPIIERATDEILGLLPAPTQQPAEQPEAGSRVLGGETINEMADLFLRWSLPYSVCSDRCVTEQASGRVGTNLLNVEEAREMVRAVVGPYLSERHHELELENTGLAGEIETLTAQLASITLENRLRKEAHARLVEVLPAGDTTPANEQVTDLRAQLATSQARLVEVEARLEFETAAKWTLSTALAQAKQEVEIVTGKLAIEREHQSSLRTANTALSAQVEELKQKLYKAEERVDSLTDPEERPAPPIKNNFPSINVSSTGEAPGSLLDT